MSLKHTFSKYLGNGDGESGCYDWSNHDVEYMIPSGGQMDQTCKIKVNVGACYCLALTAPTTKLTTPTPKPSRKVTIVQSGLAFSWTMASKTGGVVNGASDKQYPTLIVYEDDLLQFTGTVGKAHRFAVRKGKPNEPAGAIVAGPTTLGEAFTVLWGPLGPGSYTYYCLPVHSLMQVS